MIKNPKASDFPQGEEGDDQNSTEIGKMVTTSKASSSIIHVNASSSPWLRLKDPRIVRVSRVFGGKDRHSKVCTIRGLRDRRVRLSVPTAIQLYDLQDRLGLNQPSKVVDWLLNAAKHEIDELPPLPMPMPIPIPGTFELRGEAANSSQSNCQDQGVLVKDDHSANIEWELGNSSSGRLGRTSNFWSPSSNDQKGNNLRGTRNNNINHEEVVIEKEEGNNHHHPFFPGMINNIANNMPSSYPNYPLLMSHLGGGTGGGGGLAEHNNLQSLNVVSLQPSTLSLSTGSQFLFATPSSNTSTTTTTQTYFPNSTSHGMEIHDYPIRSQAMSHFQMLSSSSLSLQSLVLPNTMMRPLSFHFGTSNSTNDHNVGSASQQSKERE